jgi:hypothetical protein
MKKVLTVLMVCLLTFSLTACGSNPRRANKTFLSMEQGFSFSYPNEWEIYIEPQSELNDINDFYMYASNLHNRVLYYMSFEKTIPGFLDFILTDSIEEVDAFFADMYDSYEITETMLDDTPARRISLVEGNHTTVNYYLVVNDQLFIIYYGYEIGTAEEGIAMPIYEEIVASFKVLK